jgi:aspartate/methionine/tyrosine aminotransferase
VGAKHNLANSSSLPISVKGLESLPENASVQHDLFSSIHSKPMDYGASFNGLPALRTKISNLYLDGSSKAVLPENVLTTPGASLANFIVFYALVGPGDHVIVTYPTYQQLYCVPESLGAEVSLWQAKAEDGWRLDVEDLKRLIRPNTKLIVVKYVASPYINLRT